MFSVLRDATVKLGHVIPQEPAEVSGLVEETGDSGSPTGMHEVLEKIRSGVPLKPVTPPQKSPLSLVASLKPKSLPEGSESQFNGTLREQRVEPTVLLDEQPSTSAMSMPHDYCILTESTAMSPGNDALRNLCALEKMENPGPSTGLGEASGSGGSTDDEGSTSSTLPVTSTHSTDDDQVTEPDAIELISGFEVVEDLTKECYHAPSTFQRVILELDSNSKNSSFGFHRQQDSEAIVQIPYEHAASFSETSVDRNYLEVEQSTVVLSEEMLDQNGNECRAETVLPFGPTKCTTGFSLHVSSENQLDPHFSSSVCDGVNPSSQVSSAATMAMEKSGNSDIIPATTEYQTSFGLNSVASEHNNPAQAKMLENVDDLQVDAYKNAEMAGNVASVASLRLNSLTANGKHPDAISPKSENLLFAQTIEMHPSIGSVQEDELFQIGGKPVAVHTLNIKQSLSDVSLENVLAESESQKADDCTSEDSLKAGADRDVAQLTNSEFF